MGKNNNSAVAGMSILCKIHLILLAFIMIPALILFFVYLKDFSDELYQIQKDYQQNALEAVDRSIQDECNQVTNSLNYLTNMDEIKKYISTPYTHNSSNILRLNYEVSQAFSFIQGLNENLIEQITFYSFDENMPQHGNMFLNMEWLKKDSQLTAFLESEQNSGWFMNVSGDISGWIGSDKYTQSYTVYAYKEIGIKGKQLGIFVIRVKDNQLFRELKESRPQNEILLLDQPSEELVYVYNKEMKKYLCQKLEISSVQQDITKTTIHILIWTVCGLFLMTMTSYGLLKHVFRNMYMMMDAIERAACGNFENRIPEGKSRDIKKIARQFNILLDELKDYITRTIQLEEQKSRAEATALQMQMNPHFFYNGLGILQCVLEDEKKYDMSDAVTWLSQILRYNMSLAVFASLREEADITMKYICFINTFRKKKIMYTFRADAGLYEEKVPRFILQPLTENAVKYGDGKKIDILAENTEQGMIRIIVSNSGYPIQEDILEEMNNSLDKAEIPQTGGKLGLKNIAARLRVIYGKKARIMLRYTEKVEVHIIFPITGGKKMTEYS